MYQLMFFLLFSYVYNFVKAVQIFSFCTLYCVFNIHINIGTLSYPLYSSKSFVHYTQDGTSLRGGGVCCHHICVSYLPLDTLEC